VCQLAKVICSICPSSNKGVNNENQFIVASADAIRTHLHILSSSFMIEEQEDASLFITSLLAHCADCFFSHMSMLPTLRPIQTIIDQTFRIKLLNIIQCSSCLNTNTKEEFVYMLSVEINNINYLSDALAHFVDQEIMTGDNAYRCSSCDGLVKATKRLAIHELSPILIVNLKRSTGFGYSTRKEIHHVKYDELLNVSPYMTNQLLESNKENQSNSGLNNSFYRLYAVINHLSSNNESGHYHSYVLASKNMWFLVNDTQYQQVSSEEVFDNKDASIFFYAKTFDAPSNIGHLAQQNLLQCSSTNNNAASHSSSVFNSSV
jgi:ubiquitin C-terminal hydrolase